MVDRTGVTILYNAQAGLNDGLTPEEAMGHHVLKVFPSLSEQTSTLLKVLQTGRPIVRQEQTFTNYKGHRVTTINSTWPIFDQQGDLIAAMEISKDITRVRELSEQVVDLQAVLQAKRRRRSVLHKDARYSFDDLIGQDPVFEQVKDLALRAARGNSSVLIYGETGTGKELLVHAIHRASERRNGPFVAQNCAALPESLLEGILFGTVRGSFTGAEDRPGLLEIADGGTLYLDEINSMNLELQAKLLRVLQDGRIRRVGDTQERSVDLRIIASTNEEPEMAVRERRLRQDLYYRINVVYLELPPLRQRPGDVLLLAGHFFRKHRERSEAAVRGFSAEVERFFKSYHWPGNVRELEHAVEASVQMARGPIVELHDLPSHLQRVSAAPARALSVRPTIEPHELRSALTTTEREAILGALRHCRWNLSRTARLLGLPRQTLQYRLKVLGLPRTRAEGEAQ